MSSRPDLFARSLLPAGTAANQIAGSLPVPLRLAVALLDGLGTVTVRGRPYYRMDDIRERIQGQDPLRQLCPEVSPSGKITKRVFGVLPGER